MPERIRDREGQGDTLSVPLHYPDFGIIKHQDLLAISIKGDPCLESGRISGYFLYIAEPETVVLDALACCQLIDGRRLEVIVTGLGTYDLDRFAERCYA